jgi:hypothetical protein
MPSKEIKPDFIVCGAAKSGTSSLICYLSKHPEIYVPETKGELSFFNRNYERGLTWYADAFANKKAGQIAGEKSVSYMTKSTLVASRMYDLVPNAKLIFILRNPVERAYSNYRFDLSRGTPNDIVGKTFEEALKSSTGKRYLRIGRYIDNLRDYANLYDRDKMMVIIYEEYKKDPVTELNRLFSFLRVKQFEPSLAKTNVTKTLRYKSLSRVLALLYWDNRIAPVVRKVSMLVPTSMNALMKRFFRKVFFRSDPVKLLNPKLRSELSEYYAPYNKELEKFLVKDISLWN